MIKQIGYLTVGLGVVAVATLAIVGTGASIVAKKTSEFLISKGKEVIDEINKEKTNE